MNTVDTIFDWFFLVAIGLVVLAFLVVAVLLAVTFLAALWEKQYVDTYTPLLPGDRLEANSYYTVMNQLAPGSGYQPGGEYYANRSGAFSKVRAAFWLSADALTVAVIAGGKVARTRYRKTLLFSRRRDGTTLLTIDDHTIFDLSETRETKVVLRANFEELARVHSARVRVVGDSVEPFVREKVLQQMNQMEAERVQRLVALGYGRYLDPQQSCWRHTFRGAWRITFMGFLRGIQQAEDQSDRQHLSRPGG